jgi:hypothetical protein
MPLDAPPEIPLITEPTTFAERAQDWVVWQADELYPFLVSSSSLLGLSLSATSTTSNTIGTGSKSFGTQTGKGFIPGQSLSVARTAAPTNRMFVVVDSYNSITGALVLTSQAFEGSGTFTDWSIAPAFNGVISTNQINDLAVTEPKLADLVFNALTTAIPALTDYFPGADTSASGNKKKFLASAIRDLFYPRGHIAGLIMSTAGSSATMSIAAGEAKDSTNSTVMQLAAATAKTTSSWAVGTGNGGKAETGAVANSTWYHFYLIYRSDTGVTDICFSTSATGLVAGSYVSGGGNVANAYTQFRRIGSGLTNGSAQWVKFFQFNDEFWWDVPVDDISTSAQGTTPIDYPLTVPTGVRVKAIGNPAYMSDGVYLYTPDFTGDSPTIGTTPAGPNMASSAAGGVIEVWTNTSAQIRADGQAAARNIYWKTLGWKDYRGVND